jgi:hypothetical protein
MTSESLGANAMAPIAKVVAVSVSRAHDTPRSRLSQTPPFAAPINHCLGSRGFTAMVETRPLLNFSALVGSSRSVNGDGPMLIQ